MKPREADMAALLFLGKGRCFWPDCRVKICAMVDGKNVFDAVRAHIEAAEENGPRWNPNMTDEQRRSPENLMWLCQKHHVTVDDNPEKYTVEVLKRWKSERQIQDPAQQLIDGLTETRLREVLDESMKHLINGLDDLKLPSHEVAEMLISASESLPTSEIAELLYHAGNLLPSEDTTETLYRAAMRFPSEHVAEMLHDAAMQFPGEDLTEMLLTASSRFPNQSNISDLRQTINDLQRAADEIREVTWESPSATIGANNHNNTNDPWKWFGAGVIVTCITSGIVLAIIIYLTNR